VALGIFLFFVGKRVLRRCSNFGKFIFYDVWRHIRHSYVMVRHMEMKLCLIDSETPCLYLLPIHLWGLKPTVKKFLVHWNFQWRPSWKYANKPCSRGQNTRDFFSGTHHDPLKQLKQKNDLLQFFGGSSVYWPDYVTVTQSYSDDSAIRSVLPVLLINSSFLAS